MMTPTVVFLFSCEIVHENGKTQTVNDTTRRGGYEATQYARSMGVKISESTVLRAHQQKTFLADQRTVLRSLPAEIKKTVHGVQSPVINVYLKFQRKK